MTRAVLLSHSSAPSGAELAWARRVAVRPEGWDVTVVMGEVAGIGPRFADAGAHLVVRPLPRAMRQTRRSSRAATKLIGLVRACAYGLGLRQVIRDVSADVVVATSLKSCVYGWIATIGTGIPLVWSVHDRLSSDYLGGAAARAARLLAGRVDALIVNSDTTRATTPRTGRPLLVSPPGIDLRVWDASERSAFELGVMSVAVLGRLSPWKGQDVAIQAFSEAFSDSSAILHVVGGALFGEDEYAQSLHDLVDELGLGDRVQFHGHVDTPAKILAGSDVMLHASVIPEPFGSVVIEGMAAGCVVIASQPGGPAEVITDGLDGYLVNCGDVAAISKVLVELRTLEPAAKTRLVVAARRRAEQYDVKGLSRDTFAWLGEIVRGAKVPEVQVLPKLEERS